MYSYVVVVAGSVGSLSHLLFSRIFAEADVGAMAVERSLLNRNTRALLGGKHAKAIRSVRRGSRLMMISDSEIYAEAYVVPARV